MTGVESLMLPCTLHVVYSHAVEQAAHAIRRPAGQLLWGQAGGR